MDETSNYYSLFNDEIEGRLDFKFNHPNYHELFEKLKTIETKHLYDILLEPIIKGVQPQYDEDENVMVIKTVDMKNRFIDYENTLKTSNEFYKSNPTGHLKLNDIIIASIGVGSVGKIDIYDISDPAIFDGINLNVLRIDTEQYDPYFLMYFLRSLYGQEQIDKVIAGSTGMIYISPDYINNLIIPDLKKPLQEEIVKKIRPLESQAFRLENEVNVIINKALEVFLKELQIKSPIITEKVEYYTKFVVGLNRLDFEFNNPKYEIIDRLISESDVEFVELLDVVDFLRDSRNPMKTPNEEFIYLDISSIDTRWGVTNPTIMKGMDAESSRIRRVMYGGNVLVSTTRPNRNAITIVPDELNNQICSTGLSVLKCKQDMNNRFLFYALRSKLSNLQFERYCSGSGYPAINQEIDLPKIRVPKPSPDKQLEIVEIVDNILKEAVEKERETIMIWKEVKDKFESLIFS